MSTAIKAAIKAAREILSNPAEPAWRHEQAQCTIDRYSHINAQADDAAKVRKALVTAARIARALGLKVTASKTRDGKVSSYYIGSDSKKMRVSDHALPSTPKREAQSEFHGGKSAHMAELIVDAHFTENDIRSEIAAAFNL